MNPPTDFGCGATRRECVFPIGWYQQGRELELKLDDEQFRIRLDELVERGHDYQRARFATISNG